MIPKSARVEKSGKERSRAENSGVGRRRTEKGGEE